MREELRMIEESRPDVFWSTWTRGVNLPIELDAKPIIVEEEMAELGIVNIKALLDKTVAAVELGKEISKDGITISDIFAIPKAAGIMIEAFSKYPKAVEEFKDLSAQEILELVTYTGTSVLKVIFGEDFTKKVK